MAEFYFDAVRLSEIDLVSRTTLTDPHLAYRPPALLSQSQAAGHLLAGRDSHGTLIGWVEIYSLWGRDWGISTLYVFPHWRRRGLGARLLHRADRQLSSRRVFIATRHPSVAKTLLTLHYHPLDFWQVPKLALAAQAFTRYYHPASWLKLFTSAGRGLKYYVRP